MTNPTVSVITPVGPAWSKDFLIDVKESLQLNTTDYEWILSCDGANFHDVARSVVAEHSSSTKVIGGTNRVGIARARNRALALARGEWVYPMDSDDICLQGIDKLLEAALNNQTVWAAGLAYDVDETGMNIIYEPDDNLAPFHDIIPLNGFLDQKNKTGQYPFLCAGATFIRADVVRKLSGWDEELRDAGEDITLMVKVSANYEGAWVNNPVMFYRKHLASITAGRRFREDLKSRIARRSDSNFDVETGRLLGPRSIGHTSDSYDDSLR